ncbi:hypothetical protein PPL_03088 [Heterostelium album PN500]|uniref:Telomere-associated protein Rif1 N-terminal domain-containing protein n=1 Tax=Heterostelium pallidum (strain ATCC 26659 / Pp 5 / PN500) TaxID=670386 RepID=D3B3W7_HETP5|nr:hypothetical protein PPL_03088 [Heterostelium album PN500]EFA84015.1 hypothetical protein PPL_03088 [Heterostelium album PN500]|eukprot:XP_020436132.1 hypothetical protein PPL_03088 [Heterostelium album PN500]
MIEYICSEKIEDILKSLISSNSTINQNEQLRKALVDGHAEAIEKMNNLYESSNHLFAIRVWGYYVYFLGEGLFTNGSVINSLLKLPEKTFVHTNEEIRFQTFQSWRYLIDSVQNESLLMPKRLLLITRPITAGFKQTEVDQSCFLTWIHLLSVIGSTNIVNLFPYIFSPIVPLALEDANFSNYCYTIICALFSKENSSFNNKLKVDFQISLKSMPELSGQWLLANIKVIIQVLQYFRVDHSGKSLSSETQKLNDSITIEDADLLQTNQLRERIEIWSSMLERVALVDTKDCNSVALTQLVLKSMEAISNSAIEFTLAHHNETTNEFIIHFIKSVHNIVIRILPKSILYSQEYKTQKLPDRDDSIMIPYVNLIEVGLIDKLNIGLSLLPIINEIIQFSCSNSPDISSKINSILDIFYPVLIKKELDIKDLKFIIQFWVQNSSIVQNFIDRSQQISSNSIGSSKSINIKSILLWPLKVVSLCDNWDTSKQKEDDGDSELSIICDSLVQSWKSLLQSFHRYSSIRTSSNPLVEQIIDGIESSTNWKHPSNLEIYVGVVSTLLSILDPTSSTSSSSSKKKNDQMEAFFTHIFSFINKIFMLVDGNKYLPCIQSELNTSSSQQQKEHLASFKKICNQSWHSLLDVSSKAVGTNHEQGDQLLLAIGELLNTAFLSKQTLVTEKTLDFWNSTFGDRKHLNYSSTLWTTLSAVKRKVDIKLPPRENPPDLDDSFDDNSNRIIPAATLGSFQGSLQLLPEIKMAPTDFQFDRDHIMKKNNKDNNNNNNQSNNKNNNKVNGKEKEKEKEQPLKRKKLSPDQKQHEEIDQNETKEILFVLDSPVQASKKSSPQNSSANSTPNLQIALCDDSTMEMDNINHQHSNDYQKEEYIKTQLTMMSTLNFENFSNQSLLEYQGLALLIANEINGTLQKRLAK